MLRIVPARCRISSAQLRTHRLVVAPGTVEGLVGYCLRTMIPSGHRYSLSVGRPHKEIQLHCLHRGSILRPSVERPYKEIHLHAATLY